MLLSALIHENIRNTLLQSEALSKFVIEKIEDMKGRDIETLNVIGKASFTDFMIVCSGNSKRHVKSIAQNVAMECRAAGTEPLSVEGNDVGEWSLVDLGDVIVHIMTDEQRDKYQLEDLWSNSKKSS
jgi:ribosome-associated protein|tara:strand:- start:1019 stop:1399 length:381 start_codon:yes stop_codon:yes gene_type:complete